MTQKKHKTKTVSAKKEMLSALKGLADMVKEGADSGDWGNWEAEDQPAYAEAMRVINKAESKP